MLEWTHRWRQNDSDFTKNITKLTLEGYITSFTLHIGGANADRVVCNLFKYPGIFDEPPVEITVEHNVYLMSFTELLMISMSMCWTPLKFSLPLKSLSAISDTWLYANVIVFPSGNSYELLFSDASKVSNACFMSLAKQVFLNGLFGAGEKGCRTSVATPWSAFGTFTCPEERSLPRVGLWAAAQSSANCACSSAQSPSLHQLQGLRRGCEERKTQY